MSYFDSLTRRGSALLTTASGTRGAVVLVGLGPGGSNLVVRGVVGRVAIRRETIDEGTHETREHVEELTVRVETDRDVPLSTAVVVPATGEAAWTIDDVRREGALEKLMLYRAHPTHKQRSRVERGIR